MRSRARRHDTCILGGVLQYLQAHDLPFHLSEKLTTALTATHEFTDGVADLRVGSGVGVPARFRGSSAVVGGRELPTAFAETRQRLDARDALG